MPGRTLSTRTLSKSDFAAARTCDAKLFFRENRFPDNSTDNAYLRLLAFGGYMVEALACAKRPDGIALEHGNSPAEDSRQTLEYLERENVTLFGATLLWERRIARVDILEKRGNVIRLLEVKAKSLDGVAHLESLQAGGPGALRGKKKPHAIDSDWIAKLEDVTFQAVILQKLLPSITVVPYLVLVDKSKRASVDDLPRMFDIVPSGDGDESRRVHSVRYTGTQADLDTLDLLTEVDVSSEVAELRDAIDAAAARFESELDAPFAVPLSMRGVRCSKCEFRLDDADKESGFALCWGEMASVAPHALELFSIGKVKDLAGAPLIESLARSGTVSLFDVSEELLVKKDGTVGIQAARQVRQIRYTRSGETWTGPELGAKLQPLAYPLHFIDFEASRLALPYHANMRPYGQVAFQWSSHTLDAPGAAPRHQEWLNTEHLWPNASFIHSLRDAIGDAGTVLTWSSFERSSLKSTVSEHERFGERDGLLVSWTETLIASRLFDLHTCAEGHFYHPGMGGRTSIKVVMDALWKSDAAMREQFTRWTGDTVSALDDPYHALPPVVIAGMVQEVREGTGAVRAYEAMMYGVEKSDLAAKLAWCGLLQRYCKLDTLSMVLVYEYWRRLTGLDTVPI
jgi:hypothetical protein